MQSEPISLTQILRQKPQNTSQAFTPTPALFQPPKPEPKRKLSNKNEYRAGDWICNICNNHNYSFRALCNRCNTQTKENNLKQMLLTMSTENNENIDPNIVYKGNMDPKPVTETEGGFKGGIGGWGPRPPFADLGSGNKKSVDRNLDGLFSCFDRLIVGGDADDSECDFSLNSKFFDFMNYE